MHRWPFVTELSHGDVTLTISLSCTWSSSSQPTPQYGQIVSTTVCCALVPRPVLAHVVLGREHQRARRAHADAVAAVDARGFVQAATAYSVEMRASNPRPATAIANVFCASTPHASTHL